MRCPAALGRKGWVCHVSLSMAVVLLASCGSNEGTRSPIPTAHPLIERGAVLYQANCQSCHGGATGGKGTDIPPPHNANGHTWHHPDQQLTEIILDGFSFSVGPQKMPAFKDKLSEEDVKAVLAYIKTWWTPEQREWQAKVTAQAGQ